MALQRRFLRLRLLVLQCSSALVSYVTIDYGGGSMGSVFAPSDAAAATGATFGDYYDKLADFDSAEKIMEIFDTKMSWDDYEVPKA